MPLPRLIATGPSGLATLEAAWPVFRERACARLDALETGLRAAEADPELHDIGYGGLPDADGWMSLDAGIMDGASQRAGAVAALKGCRHPISVARLVMERTPHVLLVGEGARAFADRQGFANEGPLLSRYAEEKYQAFLRGEIEAENPDHGGGDTVGVACVDAEGEVAVATSTSGLAWKIAGRTGDSPVVGSGLYAEHRVGAACCLGMGEQMIQVAMASRVVARIASGMDPQSACELGIADLVRLRPSAATVTCLVIAIDSAGRHGGARTMDHADFHYHVADEQGIRRVDPPVVP